MTLMDFREGVLKLKDVVSAEDRFALQDVIKNVATYRLVGPVDADVMTKLLEKYAERP